MSKIIGLNVSCHDTCVAYIKDGEIKYIACIFINGLNINF